MEPTESLIVRVTDAREASAPTTWGQRAIWEWHGVADESELVHFNKGEYAPLPPGCTVATVANAVEQVLVRHDALRTVFRLTRGAWRQVVQGAGEITLDVYESGGQKADKVASTVAERLSAIPWSVGQWPLRVAVVAVDGSPAFVALATNRLALDGNSIVTIIDDLTKACTGTGSELPPSWQPVDEAMFEQSPQGLAANDRVLGHWRGALLEAPPSMFDFAVREPRGLRFRRIQLESPAMARAVRMMRRRGRVSHSALLLAAATVVLGQYTGHREVIMQTMTGNRMDRQRKALVGTLTSEGLYRLDYAGLPFTQIARRAFGASGRAHQFGFYDPDAVRALLAELRLLRGAHLDLSAYFNDVQTSLDEADDEPDPTGYELRKLAESTVVTDQGELARSPARVEVRLHLSVGHGRDIPLALFCDTRYVPPETMRELLRGMERLLIAAACGEDDADALAVVSAITPVSRGPSWTKCGSGWVDVAASQRLWREVTGTNGAAVCAEERPTGDGARRLVGYLASALPPDFTDLHRRCVDALGVRTDVRAPDRYRWVAAPPAGPYDSAAWRRMPVLAEETGSRHRNWSP